MYTSNWLEMNILKPNPIYRRGPSENEWHYHCHKCTGTKKYIYFFFDTKYCCEIYFCFVFKSLWRIKILLHICAIWNKKQHFQTFSFLKYCFLSKLPQAMPGNYANGPVVNVFTLLLLLLLGDSVLLQRSCNGTLWSPLNLYYTGLIRVDRMLAPLIWVMTL